MGDFVKILGKFPALAAPAVSADVAKAYYQATVKQKDKLVEKSCFDLDENPYYVYETLKQCLNPRKGEDKYTYHGIKKIKDKDTGISTEEEGEIAMKKFITVTAEAKIVFKFFLLAYMKQCKDYYSAHGSKFPDESKLMEELIKYSKRTSGNPVVPFIVKSSEIFNVNLHIKGGFNSIEKKLLEKAGPFFKDSDDKTPDTHLRIIIEHYIKFLNVLALLTGNMLFPARRAVNMQLMLGFVYTINTMVEEHGADLSNDTVIVLKEYVNACKPEKKSKGSKGDGDESDGDASSEEKKPKKAPAKKSGSAPAKKPGRPPRKQKSAPPAEDEGDVDGEDGISSAMDAMGEEWEDGADGFDD